MDQAKIASQFLELRSPAEPEVSSPSLNSQMEHRIGLVSGPIWAIQKGKRVLEIGCGQGDCTVVLADAVTGSGEGWVDGVDPGSPDYGAPFTLSQAQAHILSGHYGGNIAFHNLAPEAYLAKYHGPVYDYTVLSHSIWYFENPSVIHTVVTSLEGKSHTLCIAEWSLRASSKEAEPHVLAALILASVESKRKEASSGNIRTVLSPKGIQSVVERDGKWKLVRDEVRQSTVGLLDAFWEVGYAIKTREKKLGGLRADGVSEKELAALVAMYDSLESAVGLLPEGVKSVRCMDVWVARFEAV
ncbi:hypothetical protein BP5796_06680 [Coleophoma crateriformis]|uniref:Methyltransferase domain-containing protein n=1 Tax=Coleophoma crateriformis TaxID=565419 RepID=A0A3D8RP81_9HELO|nr:hypothetical protein BP5796_06680 [Coleophoma crateriformis]